MSLQPLTGCLGQFCLLITGFHVLACAYAIALPHKLIKGSEIVIAF